MIDALKRNIDHLRISVTNQCNLDCFYCHKEGNDPVQKEMSLYKIKNILDCAKKAGIKSIKFTGGEPLIRKDIIDILNYAKSLKFEKLGLTTNAILLKKYAEQLKKAGISNINIGCDSFYGVLPKNIEQIKKNIIHAKNTGIQIKLNMVVLKNINEKQIPYMIDFCKKEKINLQLIELIYIPKKSMSKSSFLKYYKSLDEIENNISKKAALSVQRKMQGRKRYYFNENNKDIKNNKNKNSSYDDSWLYIEIVKPNNSFCKKCNKIRITADGKIKKCLIKDTLNQEFNTINSIKKACITRDKYGYD